jgi:hypothetical protein
VLRAEQERGDDSVVDLRGYVMRRERPSVPELVKHSAALGATR